MAKIETSSRVAIPSSQQYTSVRSLSLTNRWHWNHGKKYAIYIVAIPIGITLPLPVATIICSLERGRQAVLSQRVNLALIQLDMDWRRLRRPRTMATDVF
jgi:hypothetical protein